MGGARRSSIIGPLFTPYHPLRIIYQAFTFAPHFSSTHSPLLPFPSAIKHLHPLLQLSLHSTTSPSILGFPSSLLSSPHSHPSPLHSSSFHPSITSHCLLHPFISPTFPSPFSITFFTQKGATLNSSFHLDPRRWVLANTLHSRHATIHPHCIHIAKMYTQTVTPDKHACEVNSKHCSSSRVLL